MAPAQSQFDVTVVETALQSNLTLQATIRAQLESIRRKKQANRLESAKCCVGEQQTQPTESLSVGRHWRREFFQDVGESPKPKPNTDTLLRRNDTFLHHTRPPWGSKEKKRFATAISEETTRTSTTHNEVSIYGRVAQRISAASKVQRTEQDCKVLDQRMQSIPISAAERKHLATLVSTMLGDDDPSHTASNSIDWSEIAKTMSHGRSQPCTPFDCLRAYKKEQQAAKKESSTTELQQSSWTLQDDTTLFQWLAAAGPQTVIDTKNPLVQHTLLQDLLPHKPILKIRTRASTSLLNPRFRHGDWTDTEERSLAVYYCIFREEGSDAVVAYVRRNKKSVTDKWNRSLNPDYLQTPFTAAEDKKLMDTIRSAECFYGWLELSERFFPRRHPHRLANRWSELATDQDLLDREEDAAIVRQTSRKRKADEV